MLIRSTSPHPAHSLTVGDDVFYTDERNVFDVPDELGVRLTGGGGFAVFTGEEPSEADALAEALAKVAELEKALEASNKARARK